MPVKASAPAGVLTLDQEKTFVALEPLAPRPIDKTYVLRLGGDMMKYNWMINGVIFDGTGNLYGTTYGDSNSTFGSVYEITP